MMVAGKRFLKFLSFFISLRDKIVLITSNDEVLVILTHASWPTFEFDLW